ncbi:hypothetical protein PM10SUCC1_25100 [Propionigenium maris DSM 9537]|uniref:Uncharacterized protein n=1 Tax=Propionigenium maris DSM 9537 TaxID=1123000 RepID=A0A9W6GNG8_9FUSO|nr:hypothetical protein [Propionigenium maris]GLI56996.1 hypothetical protein PM10SUCC1_25100 [Propionigenium maris DSM 9537]
MEKILGQINKTLNLKEMELVQHKDSFSYEKIYTSDFIEEIFSQLKEIQNESLKIFIGGYPIESETAQNTIFEGEPLKIELRFSKKNIFSTLFPDEDFDNYTFQVFKDLKKIEKKINPYNLKLFEQNFFKTRKKCINLLIEDDIYIENDYLVFISLNNCSAITSFFNYEKRLEFIESIIETREDYCHWTEGTSNLIPEVFKFHFENNKFHTNSELEVLFNASLVNCIIAYLANFTKKNDVDSELTQHSYFVGKKKIGIKAKKSIPDITEALYLFKLYRWAYESKTYERLGVIRNVVSVFLCNGNEDSNYFSLLKTAEKIYQSSQNNYDVYLNEKVDNYFLELRKFNEEIEKKSTQISESISSIIESMNKNFLALTATIVAIGFSYSKLENLNLKLIRVIALIYRIYILITSLYSFTYYYNKVNIIKKSYDNQKNEVKKFLRDSDIPKDNESSVEMSKGIFKIYLNISIFIVFFLILSSIGLYLYPKKLETFLSIIFS